VRGNEEAKMMKKDHLINNDNGNCDVCWILTNLFFPNRLADYLEMIRLRKLRFDHNCHDGSN
jgi:hypothetical protein